MVGKDEKGVGKKEVWVEEEEVEGRRWWVREMRGSGMNYYATRL